MTVLRKDDGVVELTGRCGSEDAEALQQHLLASPGSSVEWQACAYLHSAVVQVLLAARPRMQGTPQDEFLTNHIAPILQPGGGATTSRTMEREANSRIER